MMGFVSFIPCDAFLITNPNHHQHPMKEVTTQSAVHQLAHNQQRSSLMKQQTVRWAAADEDEEGYDTDDEDDDSENGPLSNGIDSVAWLPSVVGQTGESIKGAKEVSSKSIAEAESCTL